MAGLSIRTGLKQATFKLVSVCLLIFITASYFFIPKGLAAQLGARSITIGSSQPSVITTHNFTFQTVTAGNIGSIQFEYCTNSPFAGTACTAPSGLSVTSANIISQSGETGFSIDPATTANDLIISRNPSLANPATLNYVFGNITNPSAVNQSIYMRISTFASIGAVGPRTDEGAVVFDLSTGIGVGGFVP